ncbi:MAG: hypothetical protein MZV63_33315, partial [Marinilabiliales bacterium]|nr:hypothetical protein [Marinilabiliales bacterium]
QLRIRALALPSRGAFGPWARPGGWQIYQKREFLAELGKRKIERHYTEEAVEEDAALCQR